MWNNSNSGNAKPQRNPDVAFCTPAFGLFGSMIDLGVDLNPVKDRIVQCKLKYHKELWKIICERGMEGNKGWQKREGGPPEGEDGAEGGGGGEGGEDANQSNLQQQQDFGYVNSNALGRGVNGGGGQLDAPHSDVLDCWVTVPDDWVKSVAARVTAAPAPTFQLTSQQHQSVSAQPSFIRQKAQLPTSRIQADELSARFPSSGYSRSSNVTCAHPGSAPDRDFIPLFAGDWAAAADRCHDAKKSSRRQQKHSDRKRKLKL